MSDESQLDPEVELWSAQMESALEAGNSLLDKLEKQAIRFDSLSDSILAGLTGGLVTLVIVLGVALAVGMATQGAVWAAVLCSLAAMSTTMVIQRSRARERRAQERLLVAEELRAQEARIQRLMRRGAPAHVIKEEWRRYQRLADRLERLVAPQALPSAQSDRALPPGQ